jgi:hypothetical protein
MLRSSRVPITARSIAVAERVFPSRAVAGDPSLFNPRMKRTAETT